MPPGVWTLPLSMAVSKSCQCHRVALSGLLGLNGVRRLGPGHGMVGDFGEADGGRGSVGRLASRGPCVVFVPEAGNGAPGPAKRGTRVSVLLAGSPTERKTSGM